MSVPECHKLDASTLDYGCKRLACSVSWYTMLLSLKAANVF